MPEVFEYNTTITTILRKLAEKFPDSSFSVSAMAWYFDHTKNVDNVTYRIYSHKLNLSVEDKSLETVYERMLIKLKEQK